MSATIKDLLESHYWQAEILAGETNLRRRIVAAVPSSDLRDTEGLSPVEHRLVVCGLLDFPELVADELAFVRRLIDDGAAGLCVSTGKVLSSLPKDVIALAKSENFPLLLLLGLALGDVVHPARVVGELNRQLQEIESDRKRRELEIETRLLKALLSRNTLPQLVELLGEQLGYPIAVYNKSFEIIATSGVNLPEDFIGTADATPVEGSIKEPCFVRTLFLRDGGENRNTKPLTVSGLSCPLAGGYGIEGYLLVIDYGQDLDKDVVIRAAEILALSMLNARVALESKWETELDFLEALFRSKYESHDALHTRARHFGFKAISETAVILIKVDGITDTNYDLLIRRKLAVQLKSKFCTLIAADANVFAENLICILVQRPRAWEMPPLRVAAQTALDVLHEFQSNITALVGMSAVHEGLLGAVSAYDQAAQALQLGDVENAQPSVLYWDDLGAERLLQQLMSNRDDVEKLVREISEEICPATTDSSGTTLLETLRTWFNCDESISKTADKLMVHPSTIKYRLEQVERRTNLNRHKCADKMCLYVVSRLSDPFKAGKTSQVRRPLLASHRT